MPDLRGRLPIHVGAGLGFSGRQWGEKVGTETNILNQSQMPSHTYNATSTLFYRDITASTIPCILNAFDKIIGWYFVLLDLGFSTTKLPL